MILLMFKKVEKIIVEKRKNMVSRTMTFDLDKFYSRLGRLNSSSRAKRHLREARRCDRQSYVEFRTIALRRAREEV